MKLDDAIYELLGIPCTEQPADCYRLLGLARYESNPAVISNAAARQILFVRQLATGPNARVTPDVSEQIIKLLTNARIRLLSPARRRLYDAQLQAGQPQAGQAHRDEISDSVAVGLGDSVRGDSGLGERAQGDSAEHQGSRIRSAVGLASDTSLSSTKKIARHTDQSAGNENRTPGKQKPSRRKPSRRKTARPYGANPPRREIAELTAAQQLAEQAGSQVEATHVGHGPREWVIGGGPECDIVVHSPYVSRRHCRVWETEGLYWLEDLGSRNGTHVNRQRIEGRQAVDSEDLITLGTLARMPWPPREAPSDGPRREVHIVRIGRATSNDVVLRDASVSRRHAQISLFSDHAVVEDLGSTNGTYVGESALRVNRQRVTDKDVVRIGRFHLPVEQIIAGHVAGPLSK